VLTELGQADDVRFEQVTLLHHAPSDSAWMGGVTPRVTAR
jgi:hypothetical protein